MKRCAAIFLTLVVPAVLLAQDRDFLTPNEVDQVREVQEPNQRLLLYVHFAKQRMDLLQQYLAQDKPGRSIFIRNTLEDYSKIIEAIDSVSNDALLHHTNLDKGLIAVINAETEFADVLNKVDESNPRDVDRYKFLLQEAIDTTSDSAELAKEDSAKRGAELAAANAKAKSEREQSMPQKEVAQRKKAATEENEKKKTPSLYRPGEKKPDEQ